MADWSEQDYENLVTQYGQKAVDEAEEALSAMEAAGRWVGELQRFDPQQQPDGGYYSSEDDLKQQSGELRRAERSLDRATERVHALLKGNHPVLKEMVRADAELSAHFHEALIEKGPEAGTAALLLERDQRQDAARAANPEWEARHNEATAALSEYNDLAEDDAYSTYSSEAEQAAANEQLSRAGRAFRAAQAKTAVFEEAFMTADRVAYPYAHEVLDAKARYDAAAEAFDGTHESWTDAVRSDREPPEDATTEKVEAAQAAQSAAESQWRETFERNKSRLMNTTPITTAVEHHQQQLNRGAQRLADSIVSLSKQDAAVAGSGAAAPRLVNEIDAAAIKAGNLGAPQIEALATAEEGYRRELFSLARAGFEERRQAASEANGGAVFEDRALNPGLSAWLEAEAGYMAVLDDRDAMREAYGQGNSPSPQEWSRLEDRIVAAKMAADIARSELRETVNPMSNDKALFGAVRALGLTISKREDEYRITQPNLSRERAEAVAYYTSDRADAWGTASAMSRGITPGPDATPGSASNPIQIGHTAEQQLRYAVSDRAANEEAKRLADNIVSLAERHAAAQPVPGSPGAPIQIGHTADQQLRYSQRRNGREIFQSDPDPRALFDELYSDVTRTADSIPLGALERHAEARLQQSYAVLALIEQARAYGILPEAANFEATGAQVQDKRAQRDFPAAHRLPCDMKLVEPNGRENRLSEFFEIGLNRAWIEGNIFAPTDRVHRMVNVADQWCEDAGMKRSLVDASNAVLHGRMTANEAMEKVIKPGYQEAIGKATAKVERNFSFMERQALATRIVDRDGQPYKSVDPKLTLKVKGLESRAAAKDAIERTLKAYGTVQDVSLQQRMQTVSSVSAIVENERRVAMGAKSGRRNELTPGTARVEAVLAQEEAEQRLAKEMAAIKQLAAKAQQAANAAQDVTRPMSARAQALGDAATYSEHMKVAWATLQQKTGPQIMKRLEGRLSGTGPHAEAPRLKISAALQTPLPVMKETAERVETLRERFEHDERRDHDLRHQYDHRPGYGPTMN
jgi:hypothetical protein